MSWHYHEYFPRSTPKAARGGIRAQSKRGGFAESRWVKRWIAVLESFNIGARLGCGRSYARNGQVLSINIEKGMVTAKVQGSRTRPYHITLKVKPLSGADWKKLMKALSSQVIFAAKLVAGEMPQDIEEAFKEAGLSLFPDKLKDLETLCSCRRFGPATDVMHESREGVTTIKVRCENETFLGTTIRKSLRMISVRLVVKE